MYSSPELKKLVTVAKVDATLNDVPVEIQGFPTIKLFPAGAKDSPVEYSGSRTVEDLAAFIKENGSHHAEAGEEAGEFVPEEEIPMQAPAATESVKSAAAAATEAIKEAISEEEPAHDEL